MILLNWIQLKGGVFMAKTKSSTNWKQNKKIVPVKGYKKKMLRL
jgi:hypothetical protein